MRETEGLRAAVAGLRDAEKRANPASQCGRCQAYDTLRVKSAEAHLLRLIRQGELDTVLDLAEGLVHS